MKALKTLGLKRVIVVVADDINSIKAASVDDMNKAGWYRVETLKGLVAKTNTNPLRTKDASEQK